MNILELLKQKNCSMYRLAKDTNIPYSAIHDICSGKAKLTNCTAGAVYKIAKRLDISMEELIPNTMQSTASAEERMDFELFKRHICHQVKDLGDLDFIAQTLQHKEIDRLYQKNGALKHCICLRWWTIFAVKMIFPSVKNIESFARKHLLSQSSRGGFYCRPIYWETIKSNSKVSILRFLNSSALIL